jgi:hypothetical protein
MCGDLERDRYVLEQVRMVSWLLEFRIIEEMCWEEDVG